MERQTQCGSGPNLSVLVRAGLCSPDQRRPAVSNSQPMASAPAGRVQLHFVTRRSVLEQTRDGQTSAYKLGGGKADGVD